MAEIKKKILYLVTQAEWGGAQKYIFDLATNLNSEFDITVATGIDGENQEFLEKLTRNGILIKQFKHLRRNINLFHDLAAIFEIAKFLRQNHFDIFHLNSSKAGVIGAIAARLNKSLDSQRSLGMTEKIIYTAHGWAYFEPLPFWRKWVYLSMEKLAAKLRQTTIVLSEKEKEIALKFKTAKKNNIFVIPNGIDFSSINFIPKDEARKILRIPDIKDVILIGVIANLYKTKGLGYLVEAIKILGIKYPIPNIKAVIIGEGEERNKLRTKIKESGLEKSFFLLGSIPEAYKYLKVFDIFVLPSLKEGLPYTILEAMAASLPIVATQVGAIPEILENEKTGVIIPLADPLSLAEAIKKLIGNPEETTRLGQAAQEAVKKFSLKKTIAETKALY